MIAKEVYAILNRPLIRRIFAAIFWRDASDAYTDALRSAVSGQLNPGNLLCFEHAIRNLPSDAPIVEIGSYCGLSANILSYYKRLHGVQNRLITCDCWELEDRHELIGRSPASWYDYRKYLKRSFVNAATSFSEDDLPCGIAAFSHDFFRSWKEQAVVNDVFDRSIQLGGPISFCYIDGNHSFEGVSQDFENCDQFLESGGYVLFDDSSMWSAHPGVRRLVKSVKELERYELIMRNPNYLFRKR
jgi:Methyltransferase domain